MPVPGVTRQRPPSAGRTGSGLRLSLWAYHWAGGLALARYILDHPGEVAGRRVLDMGAGSGLVAIAAAKARAAQVIAAEIDRYAVTALALNAERNEAQVDIRHADITGEVPPPVDLVLAGDVFYAADLATRMTGFLDHCVGAGIEVLVGGPWRSELPTARLVELARYQVSETASAVTKACGVFAFR